MTMLCTASGDGLLEDITTVENDPEAATNHLDVENQEFDICNNTCSADWFSDNTFQWKLFFYAIQILSYILVNHKLNALL